MICFMRIFSKGLQRESSKKKCGLGKRKPAGKHGVMKKCICQRIVNSGARSGTFLSINHHDSKNTIKFRSIDIFSVCLFICFIFLLIHSSTKSSIDKSMACRRHGS